MKNLFIVLGLFMTTALYVMGNDSDETFVEIDITKNPPTNIERSLILPTIEAYHTNTMVYLTFNENLGEVNIVITNTDTGAHVQTTAASSCCNLHVNITDLGLGELNVLITTENGTKYIGTFTNF